MLRQLYKTLPKTDVLLLKLNKNHNNAFKSASISVNQCNTMCTFNHNSAQVKLQNNLSDKEFVVKLKNDPDVFGNREEIEEVDSDDLKEDEFLREKPLSFQKLTTFQYANLIKGYLRKRKIKEAIDVVEVRMIKEDKVKPENYLYNLIIGACGRVGYTKKAFSLYNDMKRRALKITPGTYTALFNACANSPWPTTDGLTRATHLYEIIKEKMYVPNVTNYNAMIKAFGRGGDLLTAFSIVDQMSAEKIPFKDDTLNFLLQACVSDKDAGFRHALLVWRMFIKKRIKPSLYSYNLLLRCIRDCGLGDITVTTDVINKLLPAPKTKVPRLDAHGSHSDLNRNAPSLNNNHLLNKPNLMADTPRLGTIVSLLEVTKPEDRLLLVGGFSEFLENMKQNDCTPDIKTFTQLLDSIPSTGAAEEQLLQALKKYKIKPDIDFYNMLIKKRCSRFDYTGGKEVIKLLKASGYLPNLITYGVLGIACKTKDEAEELLTEMAEAKYRINIEILGAMLTQACHHNNFRYVLYLMEMCIREGIDPSPKFMQNLQEFKKKCKSITNDKNNPLHKSTSFLKHYKQFKAQYTEWCDEVKVAEEEVHPWQQYRQSSDTNTLHYKDKAAKTYFKPIHNSFYRQKSLIQVSSSKNKR
ncbi:hypothetical protein FQA39_LY01868 [Lamprigera yunnana]|nr:hypothetical protein FQA39_LY01868 [Lamprigera yunnana]